MSTAQTRGTFDEIRHGINRTNETVPQWTVRISLQWTVRQRTGSGTKRHLRGSRDTHRGAHGRTRITQTNLTTISTPTNAPTRTTARRPKPRPTQQLQPRSPPPPTAPRGRLRRGRPQRTRPCRARITSRAALLVGKAGLRALPRIESRPLSLSPRVPPLLYQLV